MPEYEVIYNTKIRLPEKPEHEQILNWDKPKSEQIWVREELPDFFDKVQYSRSGDLVLTPEQEEYADKEVKKCKKGIWIYINGVATYIPKKYYFYLQYWVLEDSNRPEYRDCDRRYFTFLEYWENILWCLGICRGKKRREGASSQATSNLVYEAVFYKNSNCGLISKTRDDSKDTFTDMVTFGYRHLPPFLKPKQVNKEDSVTELVFAQKSSNIGEGFVSGHKEDEGHRSKINYRAPVLNAYDRGRMSRILLDECFAKGTKILCDGFIFKNIEDIKVGDWVIVEGGKRVQVGMTCNGVDDMYLIKQPYAKDYIVNSKHRLYLEQRCSVKSIKDDGIKKMTPIEFLNLGKYKKRTTYGLRSKGLEFEEKRTLVDPYLLGLWLGDGCSDSARFVVNKIDDPEIEQYLLNFASDNGYRVTRTKEKGKVVVLNITNSNNRWGKNDLTERLEYIGVLNNKRIPIEYFNNSIDVRLKVLAGIIDTDGYAIVKNNQIVSYEIGMSRHDLVSDIQMLAKSVGFSVSNIKYKKSNFNTGVFRIHISGDLYKIPTIVNRKKAKNYKKSYEYRKNRISVEKMGVGEYFGITLVANNDNDRRLILEDFTISMNCGKFPVDVPANQLFGIIAKTLIKGVKRVGFVEMPSTVNKLTKGGVGFKAIWESADLAKKTPTVNRLVRYFCPAHDGFEGFIGRYGESVIGEPTLEQYQYLVDKWVRKDDDGNTISELSEEDIKLGAKAYIAKRRVGMEGDDLEEEIRMNPENEVELFMSANADCIFNIMNLNKQIEYLRENPIPKRKIVYYRDIDQSIRWRDLREGESSLHWEWVGSLDKPKDAIYYDNGMRPKRADVAVIGVDGITNEQGGKKYGSKASAWVFTKYNLADPNNTGLFNGHLYGRPKEKEDLYQQIMLCSEYHGFPIYWEFVADDYYTYFKKRGRLGLLAKFPLNAIDPVKRAKDTVERHYGFPTTDFAITKGNDSMISYVEHYCDKIYWIELCEDLKMYDPTKRNPFDRAVSSMIALVGGLEPVRKPPPKKMPLITVYN